MVGGKDKTEGKNKIEGKDKHDGTDDQDGSDEEGMQDEQEGEEGQEDKPETLKFRPHFAINTNYFQRPLVVEDNGPLVLDERRTTTTTKVRK
jgi:hypothetical protein